MSDREPWQPQCPEVAVGGERCELAEGHEGSHESENCMWGTVVHDWNETLKRWEEEGK